MTDEAGSRDTSGSDSSSSGSSSSGSSELGAGAAAAAPITEGEAAAFLGLTVRTLRNYRSKGRLPYREVKGRTRSVIAYERSDLERLRDELEQRRERGTHKPMPQTPTGSAGAAAAAPAAPAAAPPLRVTFGMPDAEYRQLCSEAEKYGMTVGVYARRLVREGLESRFQEEAAELRAQLGKVNAEMRNMREEICSAFEATLEFVGLSPEDAKTWVDENLR